MVDTYSSRLYDFVSRAHSAGLYVGCPVCPDPLELFTYLGCLISRPWRAGPNAGVSRVQILVVCVSVEPRPKTFVTVIWMVRCPDPA
jgi:hypothetical protein